MVVRTRSTARLAALEDGDRGEAQRDTQQFRSRERHDSAASLDSCRTDAPKEKDRGSSDRHSPREGNSTEPVNQPSNAPLKFTFTAPCLCTFHSLPPQLQFNEFVHNGYRKGYSTRDCLRSVFQWHNETVNVWTHFAAGVLAVVLLSTALSSIASGDFLGSWPGLSMLPLLSAYSLSLVYHGGMAHWTCSGHDAASEAAYNRLLCADVSGVVAALALPWVCTTYFAFSGDPKLLLLFSCILVVSSVAGVFATQSPDQTKRLIPLGMLLMSHWLTISARKQGYGMSCAESVRDNLTALEMWWYLASEALVISGGAINALFLPERFFPGKVDFFLNGHQIMHVCTLIATFTIFKAMKADHVCFVQQLQA